jgi:hypothetical protein
MSYMAALPRQRITNPAPSGHVSSGQLLALFFNPKSKSNMKIEHDLRCAIRSAEKVQRNKDNWQARHERTESAIANLLKSKPAIAAKIAKARRESKRLSELLSRQSATIDSFGLRVNCNGSSESLGMADEGKFKTAGGVLVQSPTVWNADAIIAELAAADAKQGAKILARIGIQWG